MDFFILFSLRPHHFIIFIGQGLTSSPQEMLPSTGPGLRRSSAIPGMFQSGCVGDPQLGSACGDPRLRAMNGDGWRWMIHIHIYIYIHIYILHIYIYTYIYIYIYIYIQIIYIICIPRPSKYPSKCYFTPYFQYFDHFFGVMWRV